MVGTLRYINAHKHPKGAPSRGTGGTEHSPLLLTRIPCLQLFYWSHLSYIIIWALLFFHAPNFWKWFLVPGGLFVLEKAVGTAVSRAMGLRIVEVHLLPSQVCGPNCGVHKGPCGLGSGSSSPA